MAITALEREREAHGYNSLRERERHMAITALERETRHMAITALERERGTWL